LVEDKILTGGWGLKRKVGKITKLETTLNVHPALNIVRKIK
jgi:hypothetical protein